MRILAVVASWSLWVLPSIGHAYYSTLTTGDLLERGNYEMNVETQFITDDDSGVNLVGRFDSWLSEDSNLRAVLGFGTTDFQVGGFYKWVPYPDVEGQPAIGLMAGLLYASTEGLDDISVRVHPFVSKKFEIELGEITPYGALPFGIRSMDGETDVPVQAVIGAELKTVNLEKIRFMGEIGFDINEAFTYVSLAASLQWDEENGIQFK